MSLLIALVTSTCIGVTSCEYTTFRMYECSSLCAANICSCKDEIIIVQVKKMISINKVSQMYNGCLLTAYKVFVFVCLLIFNIYFYWCNLLTHVVSMIILRSVRYHLCEKILQEKGRRKRKNVLVLSFCHCGVSLCSFHTECESCENLRFLFCRRCQQQLIVIRVLQFSCFFDFVSINYTLSV